MDKTSMTYEIKAVREAARLQQYAPPPASWPWKWCPTHAWHGLPLCQF